MTKHAAVSSVNCGLKVQPMALKKSIDLLRFFTGRLTKILVLMIAPFSWGGTAVLVTSASHSRKVRINIDSNACFLCLLTALGSDASLRCLLRKAAQPRR